MLRLSYLLFLTIFCNKAIAQNLVPNYSFEQFDTCPDNLGQIERSIGWKIFGGSNSFGNPTPDYYNSCDTGNFNVPNAFACHQQAHSGYAFAGILTFYSFPFREYIGVQLSQTLIIGQKYYISFFANLGEVIGFSCPSNKIGGRLSTVAFDKFNPIVPDNFAHFYTDSLINDTISWIRISGSIIADSNYNFLIIGNFFDDANTDTLKYNQNSNQSYYLIDDVCLSTDSLICSSLTSITILNNNSKLKIFPNPTQDNLTISFSQIECANILVYDFIGNLILKKTVERSKKVELNLSESSTGIYFVKIDFGKGKIITKQFVKL